MAKKLSEIGEFGLIDEVIAPRFKDLLGEDITGIGDDCAVMPFTDDEVQIVTTDLLIEEIHFLRAKISAFQLGFKALAVNLSDIAGMGGTPTGTFLSVAFPKNLGVAWIEKFMEGYRSLSEKENVPLLGGDTTNTPDNIVINVAVTGRMKKSEVKRRSHARPGDYVAVPDNLGDSPGGLQYILDGLPEDKFSESLLKQHLTPYPKVSEGRWLAQKEQVHAMMDVSDGVGSDLHHIVKASNVAAELYLEKTPMSDNLRKASKKYGWNAEELAYSGGEDYTLLLTVDPEAFEKLAGDFSKTFGRPLQVIGKIIEGEPGLKYLRNGKPLDGPGKGFSHF